ncbi:hypothetical protein [Sedimenticola sp.]|uniref:hypothetical protein n=1 Tax=Sedimenticola sp. TaxID=1940285 RepID=UPI003D1306D1
MKLILPLMLALFISGCYAATPNKMDSVNMSHAHMGHVTTSWGDTPNKAGLLPTAIAEAKIARQHAGFAASKPDDLAWMKMHATHVMHAMDPASTIKGPGLGYGVIKAASGVAKHINLAAKSEGASGNVKTHAVHVATAAENAAALGKEVVALGQQVQAASSSPDAAKLVNRINELTQHIIDGFDANGDGQVSWMKGEGGLMQAKQHMGFMYQGEDMMSPAY